MKTQSGTKRPTETTFKMMVAVGGRERPLTVRAMHAQHLTDGGIEFHDVSGRRLCEVPGQILISMTEESREQ